MSATSGHGGNGGKGKLRETREHGSTEKWKTETGAVGRYFYLPRQLKHAIWFNFCSLYLFMVFFFATIKANWSPQKWNLNLKLSTVKSGRHLFPCEIQLRNSLAIHILMNSIWSSKVNQALSHISSKQRA